VFKEMAERGWLPTETARLTWPQVRMIFGDGKQAGRRDQLQEFLGAVGIDPLRCPLLDQWFNRSGFSPGRELEHDIAKIGVCKIGVTDPVSE
jgi:hypothetical protein